MELLHQYWAVILKLVIKSVTTVLHSVNRYVLHISLTFLAMAVVFIGVLIGTSGGREFAARQAIGLVNQTTDWYVQAIEIKSPRYNEWSIGTLRVFAPNETTASIQLANLQLGLPVRPWEQPLTLDYVHIGQANVNLDHLLPQSVAEAPSPENDSGAASTDDRRFGLWLHSLRIDDLQVSDTKGSPLRGPAVGKAYWTPEQSLPSISLLWGDTLQPLMSLDTDGDNTAWRARADINLPAGSWPHHYLSWSADVAMRAAADVELDLETERGRIHQLNFPWQGHAVAATGDIQRLADGWQINTLAVQVDDHASNLAGTWSDSRRNITAELSLPLSLAKPWLPNWLVEADAVQPGDHVEFKLNWPDDAPWQLTGRAQAHWYGDRSLLRLTSTGTGFDVTALDGQLRVGPSELSAKGDWSWTDQTGTLRLVSTLDADIARAWWTHPGISTLALQGELTGAGRTASGDINWPQWQGIIAANGRWPSGPNMADLPWQARANAVVNYPQINWTDLDLDIRAAGQNAQLTSSGGLDITRQQLDIDWRLAEIPVDQIAGTWDQWPEGLRMRLTGAGRITGDWNDPQGSANLSARGLWKSSPWSLSMDAPELSTQRINIDQLAGRWRASQLSADVDISPNLEQSWQTWPMVARIDPLKLSFPDLAAHIEQWPVELPTGLVSLVLDVAGPLGNPDVIAAAQVDAEYADFPLQGELNWQDDTLVADFNWQDRALSLQGTGRPWDNGNWHLTLQRLQTVDLQPWISLPEELVAADLRHDLHLQVSGGPARADISLTSQHAGRWDGDVLRAELDAAAHWSNNVIEHWDIHQLDVQWGEASLNAAGRSTNEGWLPEAFSAQMNDFPLSRFIPIASIDGRVSGNSTITAEWPEWSGNVDLQVEGSRGDEILQGDIKGNFFGNAYNVGHAQLETLNLTLGDELEITGQGGYSPELWNLRLNWRGVNGRPPAELNLPDAEWRGDGELVIAGAGDDPEISLSSLWQAQLSTADNGEQLDLNLALDIATTEHDIESVLTFRRPGKQLAQLGVSLPRRPLAERLDMAWESWDFAAFWDIDIDMSDLFFWLGLEYVQIDGALRGDGVIGGTLGDPNTDGNLAWMNGALRIPEAGAELDRINVALIATDLTTLTVTGSARSGNGSVGIDGTLAIRDGRPETDIDLRLNRAAVVQRSDVQGVGTGSLNLSGSWPDLLLEGDIGLNTLNIQLNRLAGPAVAQLEIFDEKNGNGTDFTSTIRLNIGLRTLDVATISGNGLNARLSGDLRLLGTLAELETDGAFIIESGTFNLLTREFRLQEGEVRLVDEALNVNLLAVYDRMETRIEARVTGSAEQLQLQLTSQPMLPEDEIVAQLLFGKTIQNMTPFQALQLASAVNQLRGGDTFDLIVATRDSLGLDTLEIDNIGEEESDITVRVGKYLNSRVYVELDTELSDERDWRGSVEIELTPNLSVETFTRSGSTFGGVELRWRRDY
ncbi:translocation/assembly module TamB [Salinispirillum sp. LH 10-3-1]|uniref:Translocation/assembly module TamB n=1 Tax=Salinispirillum sp. LH 10-3-1 TaxID=2952525 RepID=A0AB38YI72_9GAMM